MTGERPRRPLIFGTGIIRTFQVTLKHFLGRRLTVQYPRERLPVPERSRGGLKLKGALGVETDNGITFSEMPPCQAECPANVDARGYIGLISQGRYDDAYELHLETNPLPGIISRICPHPCEDACRKGEEDAPVAICYLKRFLSDHTSDGRRRKVFSLPKERKGKKVAVIGAGPAGLAVAFYLGKCGYDVTIFERLPVTGGMLRVAVPAYRLPEEVIDLEVDLIKKLGVSIRTGVNVGPDGMSLDDILKKDFEAVFIGIGAHRALELGIEGEHLAGVIPGEQFLADYRLGRPVNLGRRVAIVGGGNTAIDCARTAIRLGCRDVRIVYRRSRAEMPALASEVEDALEEGIEIDYLVAPLKVTGVKKVEGLELQRMELGEPDESGRSRPVPVKGSEFILKVDSVIPAISRKSESDWLPAQGVELDGNGNIAVKSETGETSKDRVYAAGDAVSGPSIAIEAIGGARKAAYAIDILLNGEPSDYWRSLTPKKTTVKSRYDGEAPRGHLPKGDPKTRIKDFREVETGFPADAAKIQAERCLSCMTEECIACRICEAYCPPGAIHVTPEQNEVRRVAAYAVNYGRCQYCSICVDVCPTRTLSHTKDFEMADYTNEDVIYDRDKMLRLKSLRSR